MTILARRFIFLTLFIACAVVSEAAPQSFASSPPAPRLLIREAALRTPAQVGVPSPRTAGAPLALSIEDAVARGLRENLGALLQEAAVTSAQGNRWTTLSGLLPTISGRLATARQQINLAAFGFSLPGVPRIVGPFNVHDARVSVSQALVDVHALYDARAGAAELRAEQHTLRDARALVGLAVRNLYLQAVTSESRVKAARAQVETARTLLGQATDLKSAGVVAGIEVLRAQVQVRTQEQRAIVAENELQKEKLQLARAIGLSLDQPFRLADTMPYTPVETVPLAAALEQALGARDDYRAATELLRAAESGRKAALGEALPSLQLSADYGSIGRTWGEAQGTFAVVTQLRVPIFDAEHARGRVLEAEALVQRRQAELRDFRARVEYEVRAAFLDLKAAEELLRTAEDAMKLANQELDQTRDRFAAGVTGNIEVVQAQESVATATESYISGLYGYNLAKAALAHAVGTVRDSQDVAGGRPNGN